MIIVGPSSNGNLGKGNWVCANHWEISVKCDEDDCFTKETMKIETHEIENRFHIQKLEGLLLLTVMQNRTATSNYILSLN